ncbi:5'-methylthioadenosine/adenosylhomocysteine nucleosidase [Mariprofundus erugo]|uniref:5'-methylthioadenosine/adenosylhomocysteine nucleosidase n=1 Tax=Mariprofundus erugo TaxID=2528639 RepID=UPI0010FD99FE|nr:5'-methylthioadenosine/adenosylhomocysteine nucleosidase [Mariprofundus erugo]TLS76345.1 5'-methylthioadenosine/adenosylhomocysteine nucleosidase [Mariprofundus erugo]
MNIGIMGAMTEEISQLLQHISETGRETRGMREYVSGTLRGKKVTIVFSRWGKVAAASTATTLIERYGVNYLIFTGVAGAMDQDLHVGDIVIADTLIQHDMDASALPGIERHEIPLLGISSFKVDSRHTDSARLAAESYLSENLTTDIDVHTLHAFHIHTPRVVTGTIASGDQFIADNQSAHALREQIPALKCVEMEGAAVAQVAHEHGIPYLVIRTISDKANESAAIDFPRFIDKVASRFTCGSVLRLLDLIQHEGSAD